MRGGGAVACLQLGLGLGIGLGLALGAGPATARPPHTSIRYNSTLDAAVWDEGLGDGGGGAGMCAGASGIAASGIAAILHRSHRHTSRLPLRLRGACVCAVCRC